MVPVEPAAEPALPDGRTGLKWRRRLAEARTTLQMAEAVRRRTDVGLVAGERALHGQHQVAGRS